MRRILDVTTRLVIEFIVLISGMALAAAGDFDPSFNGVGFTRDNLSVSAFGDAVAIHSSGEIVTSGNYSSGDYQLVLWRHLTDGHLDNSFGGAGIVYPTPPPDFFGNTSVAIDYLDRIILQIQTSTGYTLYRFNFDGSPDVAFGGTGNVSVPIQGTVYSVSEIAIQGDNKIVGVGGVYGARSQFIVYRLGESGQLDSTFGGTGIVFTEITPGGGVDRAVGVTIQPDGKIVAAGRVRRSQTDLNYSMALARYLATGELDPDFGKGGTVVFSILDNDLGRRVAIQPDGRIVVMGGACSDLGGGNVYCYFGVARLNERGVLDSSFGGTGKVVTDVGAFGAGAIDLAIQFDNKIIGAGYKGYNDDFSAMNAILIRWQPDGSLDPTFGVNGISETNFGYVSSGLASVRIQADGRIVTAGGTGNDRSAAAVTARYLSE